MSAYWENIANNHCYLTCGDIVCGIIGVVGKQGYHVNQLIYDGLTVLQHRGQDAAVIMTNLRRPVQIKEVYRLGPNIFYTHMQRLQGHIGIDTLGIPPQGHHPKQSLNHVCQFTIRLVNRSQWQSNYTLLS